jgi:5-methylcytosine-specific restriction endonuclease McrA
MAKKSDTPCAGGCGKLLWSGRTSLPAGQRKCRDCRRAALSSATEQMCGRCKQQLPIAAFSPSVQHCSGAWCKPCRVEYSRERDRVRTGRSYHPPTCDDCGRETSRGATAYGRFCTQCAADRKRARESRKVSKRRTAQRFTDITAEYERELRRRTRRCSICRIWMTGKPGQASSKQLDHIIPIVLGGTHTVGNVRIICRTCNLTRPKDGTDLAGHQPTLWAQDLGAVEAMSEAQRPARRGSRCRCGRTMVSGQCPTCPLGPKRKTISPDVGKRAAAMRADGMKWQDISDVLGLSGPGTAYQVAMKYGDPKTITLWPRNQGRLMRSAA